MRGELDEIIGIVRAKELLVALKRALMWRRLLRRLRRLSSRNPRSDQPVGRAASCSRELCYVTNEFGVVQGLVTPLDVLEALRVNSRTLTKRRKSLLMVTVAGKRRYRFACLAAGA